MRYLKRHNDPILLATINLLGAASLMGFLYCLAALLHGFYTVSTPDMAVYLVWFGVSILSVYVMRRNDVWGAYALAIATLTVGIYDVIRGWATLGGALLGMSVMATVIWYAVAWRAEPHLSTTEDRERSPA